MSTPLRLQVYEGQQPAYSAELTEAVELGRQDGSEEGPYAEENLPGRRRVVIAGREERTVSRRHALLQPLPGGGVRLINLSDVQPVVLPDGRELEPRGWCELTLPAALLIGVKMVRLEAGAGAAPEPALQSLAEVTLAPAARPAPAPPPAALALPDAEALVRWLQATVAVLHSAAGPGELFAQAAQAVVDLAGLDSGRVLLLEGEAWREVATRVRPWGRDRAPGPPSRRVLAEVRRQKRTLWEVPDSPDGVASSLTGVTAVVAAPVLDPRGELVGALYGDRRQGVGPGQQRPITRLEALLVELLAVAVAAGLARRQHVEAAEAARVRFEQFFTPELARHLAAQPDLLQGREAEVSVLVCDIRGYGRISERLGARGTVDWLGDVLEALSECVQARQGVLVDYVGDELMAMWGAPAEQPDHARLACRAALDMLARLPDLDGRWRAKVGEPLGLGIGVNTGLACVGNVGSRRKFKYGAQGHTVIVASRVQGASKYLRTGLLVTGATHARLGEGFAARRLGRVRVVNIGGPVELYELAASEETPWPRVRADYEEGLTAFEEQRFGEAAQVLGNLLADLPGDGPSLVLLGRAVNALLEGPAPGHPVWELPGK
jgi:adenylate cyclase